MSKLEELIKEFCPNGVEHVKLCDVADFRAGSSFPEREQGRKAGRYPFYKVVDMNKTQIYMEKANNYINEETCTKLKCKPAPKGTIIFPKVGATMGTNKKRILSIEACYDNNIMGLFAKNIDPKFLYYCFSKVDLLSLANGKGAVPSLDTEKMARIQIPLPALPVQREIVRILDSFTLYSAELTAELTARRKQYEFYRDKLLNFDIEIEWKTIEEACNMSAGGDVPKDRFSREKTEQFYVPVYSNGVDENALYGYTDKAKIFEPCITVAARGTIGYCALRTEPFFPVVRLICLCPKKEIIPKYLKYYIETIHFQVPTSGIPQLTVPMIGKYKIPVPPIDVQERIVKVLDNFDAICSDLGVGLPAEIEKRQKQYEYYRDKLLTFEEKNNNGEK